MIDVPYKILSWLLLPVWTLHTVWRSLRDGGRDYVKQRFGFYPGSTGSAEAPWQPLEPSGVSGSQTLWIHAASVGEVKTVIPLLVELRSVYPQARMLLTTVTPTGRQIAIAATRSAGLGNIRFAYLPLDYGIPVQRFLKHYTPSHTLIVETEIWPTLYRECENAQIPIVLVNGRLSDRTRRVTSGFTSHVLASALSRALGRVNLILARSQHDADGFQMLLDFNHKTTKTPSAPTSTRIHVCGNLKRLPQSTQPDHTAASDSLKTVLTARHDDIDPPICLLASTHDNEELLLVAEWMTRKRDELLVIVPRHPERGSKLAARLKKLGCNCCQRSEEEAPQATTDVYIADTLGELQDFYEISSVVFVGGSLVPVGGHNILEPAARGCAIVVGPHMDNFVEEYTELESHDAIIQQGDAAGVVETLCNLLDNPSSRENTSDKALAAMNAGEKSQDGSNEFSPEHVRQSYLEKLEPWLDS